MQEITIHYYLAEEFIACRYSGPVPRKGDSVMIDDVTYHATDVMWIEGDDLQPHADIALVVPS